ncbi:MAG: DUF5660 domain-containing protein [Patescibacteria group bacterium]|nr:DUF5660 domain-containing protein [Patescibacteria group bacterium]
MTNTKTKTSKAQNKPKIPNPLEAIKEIGKDTVNQMKQEISNLPNELFENLFGNSYPYKAPSRRYSGEIAPGETIEMSDILSGKMEQMQKMRKSIALERRLLQEEQARTEKKSQELKAQLNAIQQELLTVVKSTQGLAEEVQIAAMTSAVNPGLYHIVFFEKLLAFIKSFRAKIQEAQTWLYAVNKRSQKKNMWGINYKKHGAKYLLSSEHYLQRSAG